MVMQKEMMSWSKMDKVQVKTEIGHLHSTALTCEVGSRYKGQVGSLYHKQGTCWSREVKMFQWVLSSHWSKFEDENSKYNILISLQLHWAFTHHSKTKSKTKKNGKWNSETFFQNQKLIPKSENKWQ